MYEKSRVNPDEKRLEEQRAQAQFVKMTQTPIPRLIIKLSVPTVLSMLVMALYNLADTYFVAQLGNAQGGAVGIVFSVMGIIQAFGFTLGTGSSSLISRRLGEQDRQAASMYAANAFYMGAVIGLIIMAVGLSFLDPLMLAIGSTETILPYAREYALYILIGAPIMCMSIEMNNILRAEGKAALSAVGLMSGTVLNIGLDYLFVMQLNLGVGGAAVATLIGQAVSFFVLLTAFLAHKSQISLHPRHLSRHFRDYFEIWKVGFPALCRQGISSLSNIALNVNAAPYGDAAINAVTIVGRIFMVIFSVMLGVGQGFQPVAGYNYGARLYKRVRNAFWFTVAAGFCLMLVLSTLGFFLAEPVMRAFRDDDQVVQIGTLMMQVQCLGMLVMPPSTGANMLFQSVGKAGRAVFLSCCRQGIFFLPLIYILPRCIGILGVQIALPVADVLTTIVSLAVVLPFLAELKRMETESSAAAAA